MRKASGKRTTFASRPLAPLSLLSRGRFAALSLLCALAIVIQCVFVAPHTHAAGEQAWAIQDIGQDSGAQAAADARDDNGAGRQRHDNGLSASCFLCQQMALAGAAILPETASLAPMPAVVEDRLLYFAADKRTSAVSHSWRSRGPPTFL